MVENDKRSDAKAMLKTPKEQKASGEKWARYMKEEPIYSLG